MVSQQDIAEPILSLFSPGVVGDTILIGTVALVATAVDDVGVVGVQFQLNGQNIGAEQLVNTAYQPADSRNWDLMHKYTLSWNAAAVSNGSYLLTAVARDAAGHNTTPPRGRVTSRHWTSREDGKEARPREGCGEPHRCADSCHPEGLAQDHPAQPLWRRAKCHAHTQLAGLLGNGRRHDAVEPDGGEDERRDCERREQHGVEPRPC